MNRNFDQWNYGCKDGLPICLGYFAVSFTFGIMAAGAKLSPWQAVFMSLTNLTSAGQFAGLGIITAGAPYMEMAVTQIIINLRYCLMSCSLSQKLDEKTPFFHRFFIGYGVTDEIFGVSVCRPGTLHPWYSYGLITVAVPGWTLGTLAGVLSGGLLPNRLLSALNVALYGMFLAVVIPPAKDSRVLTGVIIISMAASLLFTRIPALNSVSSGFKIILLTIVIASAAAWKFPVTQPDAPKEAAHE